MNKLIRYNYNKLVNFRNTKIIYCKFCLNYYFNNTFYKHLQFCTNFINYKNKYTVKKILPKKLVYSNCNYEQFIKNKRIIIVGPSISTQRCNLGKFIDSFDIIVRINKSLPVPKNMYKHIGSRTDILYNSLNRTDHPNENNIHPNFLKRQKIKYLRCSYPPIYPFLADIKSFYRKNKNMIKFSHIDTDYYSKLNNSLKTRPYSGTCAIADLLKYNIKELFVMGIDFYTYSYTQFYRKISKSKLQKLRNNRIHEREPQINLLKRFYLLDKRLVVDNILNNILVSNYNYFYNTINKNIDFNKIFISGLGNEFILNKNTKICIIGNHPFTNDNYDIVLDLFPQRDIPIRHKNCYHIYKNIKEYNYDNNKSIFTQISIDKLKYFKKDKFIFINKHFISFLKKLLIRTVINKGTLSYELLIILIFKIYFKNITLINIDLNKNWVNNNNKEHYIQQRMLFQYLIKNI